MTTSKRTFAKSSPKGAYSAPALEKGMDIIDLLADVDSGLTVSEIAQRLNRRMSELFRIIMVMERRQWLHKDPDSARYSLTYELMKLAHRGTPAKRLSQAAGPVMHALSISIDQSCHLVVRSGSQGLVILRQENQKRHANLSVRLGAVFGLASTCSGQLLLAFLEPDEAAELLRDLTLPRASTRTALDRSLARIRKRGYEIQRSTITDGVTDISYPIRGFDGRVMAALTVPYLHVRDNSLPTTVEQTRKMLEKAAARISQSLGWTR